MPLTIRPRQFQDVVETEDGQLLPRWIGPQRQFGVCVEAPLDVDSSQWHVRFRFDGRPSAGDAFRPSFTQSGTTLCFFDRPPADLASSDALEVCTTLRDDFDERTRPLPCFRAVYDADPTDYRAVVGPAIGLISRRGELPPRARIAALEEMAASAEQAGYPSIGIFLRLVAVYEARRQGHAEGRDEARRLLATLPAWLDDPLLAMTKSKQIYEVGMLDLARGELRTAWQTLADAMTLARHTASSEWLMIAMAQADIMTQLGAGNAPRRRLHRALDACDSWQCDPTQYSQGRTSLAWQILIDPDADDTALAEVDDWLAQAEETSFWNDPVERANLRINQALSASRRGTPWRPPLDEARDLLRGLAPTPSIDTYLGWASVVEGLARLADADPDDVDPDGAVSACAEATAGASPRLVARAWSCIGQAKRTLGDLEAADEAFGRALVRHQLVTARDLGQDLSLAPGWRTDDFLRTARVAIERGDAERAWQILDRLDRLAVDVASTCGDESEDFRSDLEARRQGLLKQLALTEPPHAPAREAQLAPVRDALLSSLDEVQRSLLGSCRRTPAARAAPAHLRAFSLPEEILLLARDDAGEVRLLRRTPYPRTELRRDLRRLAVLQEGARISDVAWRRLVAPLAQALVPTSPSALPRVTSYALHGVLQQTPLAALPITTPEGPGWLGDVTVPIVRPSRIERSIATSEPSKPLFVVDPLRNLPSGASSLAGYRNHFPDARFLHGDAASRAAVSETLGKASFLHVDAHGRFDEAFPRLSGIVMADGLLQVADLDDLPMPHHFANLSGCHTGSALPTGGSGRYGLAGLLAARGVPWVLASRTAIEDRLGALFNDAFYQQIDAGQAVPEAFSSAIAQLRPYFPAAAWSSLFLVGGGPIDTTAGAKPPVR